MIYAIEDLFPFEGPYVFVLSMGLVDLILRRQ